MKKTIVQIVAENKEKCLACGTPKDLYLLGVELGFNSRAAFPRYKKALLAVCGIDYDAVKLARTESIEASISASVEFEITLYTDFKMKTDKFAVCDRSKNVVGFGKTFEELEQSQGELWTALKALDIAASAKRNLKIQAIRLNLFVDAQWLTSLSGKAEILATTARKFGIELNIQWIPGTTNPADEWTTAASYQKIDWTATGDLVSKIGESVEIKAEPEVIQPASQPEIQAVQTSTGTTAQLENSSRSDRGPEFQAWFEAHAAQWPLIRDGWKSQGLTSRERDQKLYETVKEWAISTNYSPIQH